MIDDLLSIYCTCNKTLEHQRIRIYFIYVFEFKCDTSPSVALEQIESKDYALPFVADDRDLYKIGVAFDSKTRKLVDWVIEGCIKVPE